MVKSAQMCLSSGKILHGKVFKMDTIISEGYSLCTILTLGTKQGSWILGGGWNNDLWGGDLPAASWIDGVTPNIPVSHIFSNDPFYLKIFIHTM